jgi:hypothetical protein
VVYGMCASGRDLLPAEVRKSVVALVRAHCGLGLKALAGVFVTDPTTEDLAAFTWLERASASAAVAARMLEIYYETGIRALLPAIRARTAVLHREADRGTRFELGREADSDSAARFEPPTYHGDWLAVLDAMLGFLCKPREPGAAADRTRARGRRSGRRRADQSRHRQAFVGCAADSGGARGEHPAHAGSALASPDRGVGHRAPAERLVRWP